MRPFPTPLALGVLAALALGLAACDSGLGGDPNANEPPETALSVRVRDLRETIDGTLTSTVEAAWSATDTDGLVVAYEVRTYDVALDGQVGPEELWTRTTRRDSTMLLPIPPGAETAAVVLEVRAIDDAGAKDPTPARTVFPIRNAPPALRLVASSAPPDTTWPAVTFEWAASDPDGDANLSAIEVALNDTTAGFLRLPASVTVVTFVATDPSATETDAEVLFGRAGTRPGLTIPGLRPGAENTLYVRAVDAAEFRSRTVAYPEPDTPERWFVQRVTSPVLLVNDYRTERNGTVLAYHRAVLDAYRSGGPVDEWYLATPFQTGSTIETRPAFNFPPVEPTLRETLRFWTHIYWVSSNATNRTLGNNLPYAASSLVGFLGGGGHLFVNVPIRLPSSPDDNIGNGALSLLPLSDLLSFGAGSPYPNYTPVLDLFVGAALTPQTALPSGPLPALRVRRFTGGTFGYPVGGGARALYTADYTVTTTTGTLEPWPGPSTVASLSADGRVGLFALPFVSDLNGLPILEGADGDPDAPAQAVQQILDALTFPR